MIIEITDTGPRMMAKYCSSERVCLKLALKVPYWDAIKRIGLAAEPSIRPDQELKEYPWDELAVHVIAVPLLILIEALERAGCPLHSRSPTLGGLTLKVTLTITESLLPSIIDTISDPVLVTYIMLETEFTATRLAMRGNFAKIGIFNTGSPLA
jgi:hypothetical protein